MDETVRVPRVEASLHEVERAVDDNTRAIINAVDELRAAQDTTNVLLRKILNRLTDPVLRDADYFEKG